jgi:hypothetical protein
METDNTHRRGGVVTVAAEAPHCDFLPVAEMLAKRASLKNGTWQPELWED